MAQIFNPWADPPSTGALTGDLASFEINGMEESEDSGQETDSGEALEDSTSESEHSDTMAQALQVISQQAALIESLMKSLGKTA